MLRGKTGQIFILLAPGFEEMDVTTIAGTLRRAGFPVALVGLAAGPIRGAYGLLIAPDKALSEVEADRPRAIVLPGGIQGTRLLNSEPRVHALLRQAAEGDGYLLAIDTAYTVLVQCRLLPWHGKTPPLAPGVEWPGTMCPSQCIWIDGRIIFCRSSNASREAALTLAASLEQTSRYSA
jgi:4-methyl-5(b-hydroxyethyl)-thiazole monophosphate biosynthesis